MSYIKIIDTNLPGISGLLQTYQETAKPLTLLAETLLRKESAHFNKFERELLASYVSYLNNCVFCSESHGAVANYYSEDQQAQMIWQNPNSNLITKKLQHILHLGQKIQSQAKSVSENDISVCKDFGMNDDEINDMALISSAFCMYNRYVDALGTKYPPAGDLAYKTMGKVLAQQGYLKK